MQRWVWLPALTLLAAGPLAAQGPGPATGRIVGTVTTDAGQPLAGANVIVVGTPLGAVTGNAGQYTISGVPAGARQVQARRVGYAPITRPVAVTAGQPTTADFRLAVQALQLQGVVAVGYGTQSRREVTGAVSSIRSEDITQIVSANPADAIKGRLPGVDVTASSFEPGAAATIRIRGARSISANNNPLYVVDGVPITGDLRDLDQNSIASIEVLKDAAAAAVYGSRGANGVLLVTTKKGRSGPTEYTASSTVGASKLSREVDMMDAQEFANFRRETYRASSTTANPNRCATWTPAADAATTAACDLDALDAKMRAGLAAGVNTDWQQEVARTGVLQNHQFAAAGGNENTRFRAGINYIGQQGITLTQGYTQRSGNVALNHDRGRVSLQASALVNQSVRDAGAGLSVWNEALYNSPLGAPRDSAGNLILLPTDDALRVNPVSNAINNTLTVRRTNVLGTITGAYEFAPGLRLNSSFGPQFTLSEGGFFVGTESGRFRGAAGSQPTAGQNNARNSNYTWSNFLSLDRQVGAQHRVQGTLLYELAQFRTSFDSAGATNLPYASQLWYNLGSGQNYRVLSRLSQYTLQSYMARANYTYRDRYTLNLVGRVDGSSVLSPGNKYAFFPAASLGWQVGDEPFLRGVKALSDLKLRASYGRVGTAAVDPYQTLGQLATTWYTFGTSAPSALGYQPNSIPNPDLKWETTDKLNLGLDFGVFEQRISGALDVYREKTSNLLLTRALPYTSGFTSILQNIGATRNSGIELSLSTVNLRGDQGGGRGLGWTSDFAFSRNWNRIAALVGGVNDVASSRFVGQPINVNYNYKFAGIWQTPDSALARTFGARPGDIRVADVNGDGKIDGNDRTFIGNAFNFPKFQGSFNNRFRFRRLDASVLTTARLGYTVSSPFLSAYNGLAGRFNNLDVNYWTPEHPSNEFPRPYLAGTGNFNQAIWFQDASHVRIRDITLGYTIPPTLFGRAGVTRARLYGRVQDPFIFTKFKGWDPESGFNGGPAGTGYDYNQFTTSQLDVGGPAYRTFLFGLDLGF